VSISLTVATGTTGAGREQQWHRGCADPADVSAQKTRSVPLKAIRLWTLPIERASFRSLGSTGVESPQAPGAATRGPALANGAAAGFPASTSPPLVSLSHILYRVRGAWCSAGARSRALPRCKLGARLQVQRRARALRTL